MLAKAWYHSAKHTEYHLFPLDSICPKSKANKSSFLQNGKSTMKHRIDPKIDCVFKALLGSEENRNLLVHFLNAILTSDLTAPIAEVEILNPYNDKEFLDDKLSVVDVKAKDSEGRLYQIEIQLLTYRHLPERMVYTWCDNVGRNKPVHGRFRHNGGFCRKRSPCDLIPAYL